MPLATWGAGNGAEHGPFGVWPGPEMPPQALQEHSLAPAGASPFYLCSLQLVPVTPTPLQRLPHSQPV